MSVYAEIFPPILKHFICELQGLDCFSIFSFLVVPLSKNVTLPHTQKQTKMRIQK